MSQWMITATGCDYHLDGHQALLNSNAPRIEDIAQALSLINRYTGHTLRPYSVAEHSLLVARLAALDGAIDPSLRLACLMHDAHEAYTGDLSSPLKWALGAVWIGMEATHALNVRRHFGLQSAFAAHRAAIKHYDLVALATERRDLTAFDADRNLPWPILDTEGSRIEPSQDIYLDDDKYYDAIWKDWRDGFLVEFHALRAAHKDWAEIAA